MIISDYTIEKEIMKFKTLLFLTFFTLAFSQSNKNDDWIESGQMLRFPASKYFTAVGTGNSAKQANENAIVEIRKQISSTIKSEQIYSEFSIATENSQKDTSIFNTKSKISVAGEIAGTEIIATSKRQDNFYAFAVLEKEKFISLQKTKITELQSELIKTNALAGKAINEQKISLAISQLSAAKEKISAIQNERLLLSAATALTKSEEIPVSKAEIDGKLAQIINSIKMVAENSNNQTVFAGETSEKAFSVKIFYENIPIENIAISLFDEKNKKITTAHSDKNGIADLFLGTNAPSSRGTYKYTAKIDLPEVLNIKNLPEIRFSYSVKTKNLPAAVSVKVSSDLKNGSFAIEQATNEILSNHGILNDKCACVKFSVFISDEQKEAIDGLSSTRSFTRSNALMQITISDENDKQLYSANVNNVGTGKDKISAVVDGIHKIRLSTILNDIQNIILSAEDKPECCN